jgi:hypothetical protein
VSNQKKIIPQTMGHPPDQKNPHLAPRGPLALAATHYGHNLRRRLVEGDLTNYEW